MDVEKFDVTYRLTGPTIEPHFCREWEADTGCYGTNPDHGYTFEEAAAQIAEWHQKQAEFWRAATLEQARDAGLV